MSKKLFGTLMLLLTALLWGFGFVTQAVSGDALGSFTVVSFKASGFLVLIPLSIIAKQKFNKTTFKAGILCGLSGAAGCIFQQTGIAYSTVSKAAFITTLYIIFTPIIYAFLGKKIKRNVIIGVFIATFGMYFLCMKESFTLQVGDIYLMLAAFFFALQIIFIDHYTNEVDPLPLSCVQAAVIFIVAASGSLILEKPTISEITPVLPSLLYSAICSCAIAQSLQVKYQQDVEPTLASLLMSFEAVFGAIFGFLFLNQILSIKEIIGCVLIFIAILIAQR